MEWIKQRYIWELKRYPFFNSQIEIRNVGHGNEMYYYNNRQPATHLEIAKFQTLQRLKKVCTAVLEYKTFEQLNDHHDIVMYYNTWCNNIGEGKYCSGLWKQYHWINGRWLHTSAISNDYAIRFPIEMSEEKVKHKALIIIKRHAKRFLKELENE